MRRRWRRFLAYYRLSKKAVCEESRDLGPENDYHDYPDDEIGAPLHFTRMRCKRCRKEFVI